MNFRLSGDTMRASRSATASRARSEGVDTIPPAVHSTDRFEPVASMRSGRTRLKPLAMPAVCSNVGVAQ